MALSAPCPPNRACGLTHTVRWDRAMSCPRVERGGSREDDHSMATASMATSTGEISCPWTPLRASSGVDGVSGRTITASEASPEWRPVRSTTAPREDCYGRHTGRRVDWHRRIARLDEQTPTAGFATARRHAPARVRSDNAKPAWGQPRRCRGVREAHRRAGGPRRAAHEGSTAARPQARPGCYCALRAAGGCRFGVN